MRPPEMAFASLTVREDDRPFNVRDQPTPTHEYQLGTSSWGDVNMPPMTLRTPFVMRQVADFLYAQAREKERIMQRADREQRREAKRERKRMRA